jgi:hypothetical protein
MSVGPLALTQVNEVRYSVLWEDAMSSESASEITISAKKDTLQQIFHVIAGQPNHVVELLNDPILIGLDDIGTLHSQVMNKLKHYDVSAQEFSATVVLAETRYEEFGSWRVLADKDWHIPDRTTSVTLKWRFLIQFPGETKPSSHGVTVRIAGQPRPFEYMQAMFSKDPDEPEPLEIGPATTTCRVDFVDHLLSRELLAIVSNWHRSCRKPEAVMPFIQKLKKRSRTIRNVITNSVTVFTVATAAAYFYRWSASLASGGALTGEQFRDTISLLAGIAGFLYLAWLLGRWLAARAESYLERFGRFHLFELTSGDSNRQTELNAKNQNALMKFGVTALAALLWNVVGGVVTAWLLS